MKAQPKGVSCRRCDTDRWQANGVCAECKSRYRKKYLAENGDSVRKQQAMWRARNPDKVKRPECLEWARNLLRNYGIGPEDYERMLAAQGGQCAICKTTQPHPSKSQRFSVDHDHNTGAVRGLLCNRCNLGIGHFEDDLYFLQSAIEYLKKAARRRVA